MPTLPGRLSDERGIALVIVILITLVVAAIAVGATMVSANTQLVINYGERESVLQTAADAGLERARALINGDGSIYPTEGYQMLEDGVAVTDALGATIPGVKQWVYVGPTGITSGQYGVFGSVVVVTQDAAGNKVVRRGELVQESFAKYAYFTTVEGNIVFGGGDVLWGPVHSNDNIKIQSSGTPPRATFNGTVTTNGSISSKSNAVFNQGYTENATSIPMPLTADLSRLATQAQAGGTYFVGSTSGGAGQATTRIEFVALDLDGDGFRTGPDEGFIKVYQSSTNPGWVVASRPADYTANALRNSLNCGHRASSGTAHNGQFMNADDHGTSGGDGWTAAVTSSGRRCYLGGSDSLRNPVAFQATDSQGPGGWVQYTTAPSPLLNAYPDRNYLFPITRALNPNFRGVIYVQGKVAISGTVRGRVTLAATDNIVLADDVKLATDPSAGTCADMLGVFSGTDVVVADNTINAPLRATSSSGSWYSFDDTRDEFFQLVVLALDNFTVENYDSGATDFEDCGSTNWGRGCLYLTGGIIQRSRGAVGLTNGSGYLKRYSYDACGFSSPPPYFPTTGRFSRGRYYEVNPVGFNVADFFGMLTPPSS